MAAKAIIMLLHLCSIMGRGIIEGDIIGGKKIFLFEFGILMTLRWHSWSIMLFVCCYQLRSKSGIPQDMLIGRILLQTQFATKLETLQSMPKHY